MRDVRDGFGDGRKERMGTERGKDKTRVNTHLEKCHLHTERLTDL